MKLLSINVGQPQSIRADNQLVTTSIWKAPVAGPVEIRTLNVAGDRQSDLRVHGGWDKAVYFYPFEHYAPWHEDLPEAELPPGVFGENFTTEGLSEQGVNVGDRFRVGSAEIVITQPRLPCYKLGIRFGRRDMERRMLRSFRTGFYGAVVREGVAQAGDAIELIQRNDDGISIADVVRLYAFDRHDRAAVARAAEVAALPESWRAEFREILARPQPGS